MRARDVMVRAVATTTPETTVEKVARLMINLRISGVPVLDKNGQLVGIVTEGDLLRRAETGTERRRSRWSEWFSPNSRLAAEYIKSHARRVEDIMTREVVSVGELATLAEIAELMETKRIKRVPVVHDGKIAGIVSRADLLQVLASGGAATANEDGDRLIGGGKEGTPRCRREHPRRPRHRGSHDRSAALLGAVLSRDLKQRDASPRPGGLPVRCLTP